MVNLSISVEQLRKNKLFIATPMYGGMCLGMYMKACLDLQGMCGQYGMENRFSFIFNESLITRARNYLVDEFLRSGYTHLLFLDADIHFDPKDVLALMALDKDIIGAPYPKKSIKWNSAITAINKRHSLIKTVNEKNIEIAAENMAAQAAGPTADGAVIAKPLYDVPKELTSQEVEQTIGDYVFNPVAGTGQFNVGEPLKVMEIGTGYMMIKREVFLRWALQYPQYSYKPDHVGQANFDGSRYIHAYFDCIIDKKRQMEIQQDLGERKKGEIVEVGGSERYLSEDYFFCQQWRNMGGEIWLCPWMRTFHVGTYAFQGNMAAVAQLVGNL
jgi:hypothetical protein